MKRLASICMEVWENPMDWKIGQTPGMWTTFAASFIQPEVWFGVKSDRKMTSSNDWQWLNETASPQCIRGKNLMPSSFHGMPSKVSSLFSVLSQSILVSEDLDIWWLMLESVDTGRSISPCDLPPPWAPELWRAILTYIFEKIFTKYTLTPFTIYRQIWTYIAISWPILYNKYL